MKVYFVYEGKGVDGNQVRECSETFKVKIDIPSSWMDGPCERLLSFFVKTYAAKRGVTDMDASEVVMKVGGVLLKDKDTVSKSVREYNDIVILHKPVANTVQRDKDELLCTNFGCGKYFKEQDNTDASCHYHAKGPVFHDLEKYWSCCDGKKAFDWEAFQAIEPCQTGRHSTKNIPFSFPKEEVANQPLTVEQTQSVAAAAAAAPSDGNAPRTTGPREFEGAIFSQTEPQTVVDGKAKCRNFGCGKEFQVDNNSESECRYHSGAPVFWDTYKYWKCCPDKKCYEFEDFVAVPGCCLGSHKM